MSGPCPDCPHCAGTGERNWRRGGLGPCSCTSPWLKALHEAELEAQGLRQEIARSWQNELGARHELHDAQAALANLRRLYASTGDQLGRVTERVLAATCMDDLARLQGDLRMAAVALAQAEASGRAAFQAAYCEPALQSSLFGTHDA